EPLRPRGSTSPRGPPACWTHPPWPSWRAGWPMAGPRAWALPSSRSAWRSESSTATASPETEIRASPTVPRRDVLCGRGAVSSARMAIVTDALSPNLSTETGTRREPWTAENDGLPPLEDRYLSGPGHNGALPAQKPALSDLAVTSVVALILPV